MKRNRTWYGTRACAGLATLLATAGGSAWAQDAPQPDVEVPVEEGAAEPEGEVIIVTGSRIRTNPLDKQAPVLQLTREELERTGLTSVGDILQQLPGSGGAINGKFNSSGNFGFPPDGGGIGAGAIEADLRYLGSKRVLVLVDGVRWVNGSSASGVSAATDLNTIPLAIIERIEVLEDGASPIYGSDAISGVINIITRKQFEGVSANAYTGGYHYGDGLVHKYDVSYGNSDEKMSIVVSASYLDQRSISSADREISDSPIPGLDDCEAGCSSATPQGRFAFVDPTTGAEQDLTLNQGVVGLASYPGDFNAFDDQDRFNFAPYNLMLTPSKRLGMFSSVTYKLAPRVSFHGKASFTNRESLNQAAPEPLFIGPGGGSGNRMDRIAVHATNPYNPFGFTFDPATNPFVITRRPLESGPRQFSQNVNTFYVSGGLDGNFDLGKQRFYWDATVAYGVNRADQLRNNSVNSAKLEQALGPAYQDGGDWRCGTMASPGDPNCVPFNVFGGQGASGEGSISQAMLDYVTFVVHDVSEQTLVDAVANVAGNLIDLPTGPLSMAAGVEHRRLSGFFEPDPIVAAGDGADVPAQPTSGEYWVNEAYAELRAPLVVRMPGAELIDVNAAVRMSDYSILTPEITGKLGARWKPIADLMLRGSYARGFRAPGIGELYGSESRYDAVLNDPCSDFNRPGVPASVRQRCINDLNIPADGSYEQLNPQISVTTGGNINLEPERSDSLNISLAYSPSWLTANPWVDRFDLELAYYDIKLDGAIAPIDAQVQLDRCVGGGDDTLCESIQRNPQGIIVDFSNTLLNLGGIETRGLDVTLTYLMPATEFGRFRFASMSSYLIDFWENIPTSEGFSTIKREGRVAGEPERAFPKFKSSLVIDWFYDQVRATAITRYVHSAMEQCRDLQGFPGLCSHPDMDNDALSRNKLTAQVYNDVQLTWTPPQFDNALNITAGVNNLFNNDPPDCYSCVLNGFNATTYDVPGIFGYLTASYRMY